MYVYTFLNILLIVIFRTIQYNVYFILIFILKYEKYATEKDEYVNN